MKSHGRESKTAKEEHPSTVKQKQEEEDDAEEEDYEVEEIVGEKMEKGKKYYYLKWKGWPSSSNTWELASSLSCPDVLKKYESRNETKSSKTSKSAKPAKSEKSEQSKSGKRSSTSKASKPASKSPAKPAKEKKASKTKKKVAEDSEEQDWEVEKIVDVRYNDDGTKAFLIRWKGCDSSQDTWEPEDNVNSPDLVNNFMNKTDDSDEDVSTTKRKRKA